MHSGNVSAHDMVVVPHHLVSRSVLATLREGGSAIETVATVVTVTAVVHPHMNGLGGDGFWLIIPSEEGPIAINANGAVGLLAALEAYAGQQHIPHRGPQAALVVAGTVSGWDEALRIPRDLTGRALPMACLPADAIGYVEDGTPIIASQVHATVNRLGELRHQPGFSGTWLVAGGAPRPGSRFRQPTLAGTLYMLTSDGLDSFYHEPLAEHLAQDMVALGTPITLDDLQARRAQHPTPLTLQHQQGILWDLAPSTRRLVSLAILSTAGHLNMADADGAQTVHHIAKATGRAFALCDTHITDSCCLDVDVQQLLAPEAPQSLTGSIDGASASPWDRGKGPGDAVWTGVVDNSGLAVSFIQNIYHEFGSGVVLPDTGIAQQSRGAAFGLDPQRLLALTPDKQPFHTLSPAVAHPNDGRVMVYGSMGGDGQPQAQAAPFTRYILQGVPLQESISRPHWLLGHTWGQSLDSLKLEGRLTPAYIAHLHEPGHKVGVLADFSEAMGYTGAIVHHPNGLLKGAANPCSNDAVAGC